MLASQSIEHLAGVIAEAAKPYGVISDIHEQDFIFRHSLARNPNVVTVAKRYFDRGTYGAQRLAEFLARFSFSDRKPSRILDFASGYGCVARHFHRTLGDTANVVCCDIHQAAVDFIKARLGINAVLSDAVPERLAIDGTFDAIFVLSFFSHMPDTTWGRWLGQLANLLNPGGFVLFTTHGYESLRRANFPLREFDGFRFARESEQKDLDTGDYGYTIVSVDYATRNLPKGTRLLHFSEAEWEGYQDVYVISKLRA